MAGRLETILLVEDDPAQAELISLHLELGNLPQQIVHVPDGREALEFLERQGRYRDRQAGSVLVLLDLKLPCVDGLELLRQIKSQPKTRQTPVVVFTAEDNPRVIQECYELGCSLYVPKPFLLEEFLNTIERLAGMIQAAAVPPEPASAGPPSFSI